MCDDRKLSGLLLQPVWCLPGIENDWKWRTGYKGDFQREKERKKEKNGQKWKRGDASIAKWMPCDITREKRGAERHSTETSGIGSLLDEKQSKGECEFAFFFFQAGWRTWWPFTKMVPNLWLQRTFQVNVFQDFKEITSYFSMGLVWKKSP